ncbi:MAG: hypothetical protein ABI480_01315, partial [Chitinophagaceae bacterium]
MSENLQQDILKDFLPVPRKNLFVRAPYCLFIIAALLTTIFPMLFWGQAVDVWLGNTSMLIPADRFISILFIALFSGAVIYLFTNKYMFSITLTWVHILVTLLVVVYFLLTSKWFLKSQAESHLQGILIQTLMKGYAREIKLYTAPTLIFFGGQLV